MKKIGILIVLILVAFGLAFAFGLFEKPIERISAERFVFADEETENYIIYIELPLFLNREKANSILQDVFVKELEQFKSEVAEGLSSFRVDYEVISLSNKSASIRFSKDHYTAGAAHPNFYYSVFNYDFQTEKEISLEDLLGGGYLPRLSEVSREKLKEKLDSAYYLEDFVNPGTEPKVENFSAFNFNEDKLIINFSPYQVGPYALGPQIIEIPWSDL
ncbi:DUF3298 and DUF4163 domain-containing protein [Patescibacteria group bacterium]|nr:DUF3298 and DUF4163 domain-containing protein [Patescibacteria group bacterium]